MGFSISKRGFIRTQSLPVFLTVILLVFAGGCGKEEKKAGPTVPDQTTAERVSHITGGIISSTDPVVVRFVNPVVKVDQVGEILERPIFTFDPDIPGVARWQDTRTLTFQAREKLPYRKRYSGEVHLDKLFPELDESKRISFQFEVAGREVAEFSGDFELPDITNPDRLIYTGTISFTEPIEKDRVRQSVSLFREGKPVTLIWLEPSGDREFRFQSNPITRAKGTTEFKIRIDKDPLAISDDIEKVFTLEPLQVFKLGEIVLMDQGKRPGLELRFSHELDDRQDITGLVTVTPDVDMTLKSMGKNIHLGGDFQFGETYSISVSGIRSKWGTKLTGVIQKQVDFQDRKPQISFLHDGAVLPSANEQKIGFRTMNVKRVHLNIKKVFESNLGQFLQTESLKSRKGRNDDFNQYNIRRVGVTVLNQKLEIGTQKNRWLNHRLDLKKILKPEEKGLFLLTLSFKKEDMLYSGLTEKRQYYYGRQYYSNPNSSGYLWRHGRIFKPLILSDIGLTYKRGSRTHLVLATHILDSSPLKNVKVTLRTLQNQVVASDFTDSTGQVVFRDIKDKIFYVEAEKDDQRSVIKPDEMAWNLSSFEVGGEWISPDETRAFIYTERGVYRPGDQINLALIARNKDNSFPANHPVTMKIYNPKNQLMEEITSKTSSDGFYAFGFQSKEEDLTGNWKALFEVGSKKFYHRLKIETVVPYRLKVRLEPEKSPLGPGDNQLNLDLIANYLFGNPAAFLNAEVEVVLSHRLKRFPGYPGFIFSNDAMKFKPFKAKLFKGSLDEAGQATIKWALPPLDDVPSAVSARITAEVMEKGGRSSRNDLYVPIDPHGYYIGLQKPVLKYGYSRVGDPMGIKVILVDARGRAVSGRSLTYRIFRNSRYWWWEYDSHDDFRVRYKKDSYTRKVKEGMIVTQNTPALVSFTPENIGEYLIEIEQAVDGGHRAGFFFSSYYWGESPVGDDSAGTIVLKSDKSVYHPGETATISFAAPERGTVFVSVEKANEILNSRVQECQGKESQVSIGIPVTTEMLPNAYVSVSIIQPHNQTLNDRPLRMYGVIPLMVEEPRTRHPLSITMPDELASGQKFDIEIQTGDKKPTQFTVAVVDEGLLDLTRFPTPDPWGYFYQKQKLGISTFDLFSFVIGAHKGDVFRLFSIGGDVETELDGDSAVREPREKRRFKAVSMFKGPLMTDEKGYARLAFTMPDYIGSVRVMVISARGGSFARAEKTVPVKTELMVLPTLPRVLGPDDRIVVPVTVFAMKEDLDQVWVTLETKGPVAVVGEEKQRLFFQEPGEKDVDFMIKAYPAVGNAEITITASSSGFTARSRTDMEIRPYSPRIYSSETRECQPGESVELVIPGRGVPGTNEVTLSVMGKMIPNLNHRLGWLIHYPYGCIEQTVSAVFPQLHLKPFLKQSLITEDTVDAHVNAAIKRLRRFLTPGGGFSFWPGGRTVSIWGTTYAGHFLIEAKKLGYSVPDNLISGWVGFEKSRALSTRDNLMMRIYRLYVLALAGEPQIGAMNLIKENSLKELIDTEKWVLAAAYYLANQKETAGVILRTAGIEARQYPQMGITYGSYLRDRAIIMEMATLFGDWNRADRLYDEMVEELNSRSWYSTQTLGYALLALGKYMKANPGDFQEAKPLIKGFIRLPGRKKIPFETDGEMFTQSVSGGFGKKALVKIDEATSLGRVFVVLEWSGIPLKPDVEDVEKNLRLQVEWLDENGSTIDPSRIQQGTTFWGHFRVGPSDPRRHRLDELALVQILPSGWEIENIRLLKQDLPQWMSKWKLNREEYLDIRDDRIMWFFDFPRNVKSLDFVVKVTAVTRGDFVLPPTVFEAMYNNRYQAIKKGKSVKVVRRQ